jgi:xylan 1,4-beta-xylosidase
MMTRKLAILAVASCAVSLGWPTSAQDESVKVSIHVDASKRRGPMTPMWAFFGHDEPNYTYMPDGQKL